MVSHLGNLPQKCGGWNAREALLFSMASDQDNQAPAGLTGSDHSLLRRIRSGQTDAATDLYRRYARRIQALARKQIGPALGKRVEPEEIVQSVFRTFFRRLTEGHYEVPAGEELWGLFLVMALNKVRSAARFHGQERRDVGRTEHLAHEAQLATDDEHLATLQQVVTELLDRIPKSHSDVVSLRIEGHTVEEIASITGLSKRTTERVLQRFRARLASEIELNGTDDAS